VSWLWTPTVTTGFIRQSAPAPSGGRYCETFACSAALLQRRWVPAFAGTTVILVTRTTPTKPAVPLPSSSAAPPTLHPSMSSPQYDVGNNTRTHEFADSPTRGNLQTSPSSSPRRRGPSVVAVNADYDNRFYPPIGSRTERGRYCESFACSAALLQRRWVPAFAGTTVIFVMWTTPTKPSAPLTSSSAARQHFIHRFPHLSTISVSRAPSLR
jgi:hypothetical protein